VNVVFLAIGGIIANVLGTTGASMLLIRPWLRMNKYRVTAHHVVFFILIVSNVGGCLTPIGDPPLFLGYLKGIPFWWVLEHCWLMWLVGMTYLLAVFYVVDRRNFLRAPKEVRVEQTQHEDWRFEGLINIVFLALILVAVFIPPKPLFLREAVMLVAAVGSYFATRKSIHEANHFNFHPIQEVAILFIGIFATMMPALDYLQNHSGVLAKSGPGLFYWGTGVLSSFLDNAPTYLSFFKAAIGAFVNAENVQQIQALIATNGDSIANASEPARNTFEALQKYFAGGLSAKTVTKEQIEVAYLLGNANLNIYIVAISVAAVFFGACTYIGNGPNFMVKAIADHQKVSTPSFVGYLVRFTLPIMAPMLVLVWWLFFRG
jgi:Na+/H+ antiporter NhaD/arsenite permease-like protein